MTANRDNFSNATKLVLAQRVHWSCGEKKISKEKTTIFIKAIIDDGWYVYSQFIKDGGLVKLTITFPSSPAYILIGKTIEPTPITRNEKVFNMDVSFFKHEVVFGKK